MKGKTVLFTAEEQNFSVLCECVRIRLHVEVHQHRFELSFGKFFWIASISTLERARKLKDAVLTKKLK